MKQVRVAVLSDVHYASADERARPNYWGGAISNPARRLLIQVYRRYYWQRDPFAHNHLLDQFLQQCAAADLVIAVGDYSCDSAFVGLSDDAAFASAAECLGKLRSRFGGNFRANYGDHELGKLSFFGGRGGMRLASWHRAQEELGLEPFWELALGKYRLLSHLGSGGMNLTRIVSGGGDNTLKVWDATSGQETFIRESEDGGSP